MAPYPGHPLKLHRLTALRIWVLLRSIIFLSPPDASAQLRGGCLQARVLGRPSRGARLPLACCCSHNRFFLETLSANQTVLSGACRAAFIQLPAWL